MTVRTRFAPSPTGYLHIGGVRTALFNWLLARRHGGQFVLRIDDTDQQRNVEAALQPILDGFRWLGIDWDEGPEVGGPHGPYYQSQRAGRYRDAVDRLLQQGRGYRDYARPEEIQVERETAEKEKRPFRYSRRWMAETDEQAAAFEKDGRSSVVRLKMPAEGSCRFHDLVRGDMDVPWSGEQDHVIQRADGTCLYHLASVVDDHDFEITHVVRAVEHLSNTPRQIFIAESLDLSIPEFAHLPYVSEPGSSTKLSKRKLNKYLKHREFARMFEHGSGIRERLGESVDAETFNPVLVDFYRRSGYLPDAVVNYLLLLGWSWDDKAEFFDRREMIEKFALERVNKAPASFDPDKLWAFQQHYMQELDRKKKVALVLPYLQQAGWVSTPPPCEISEKIGSILDAAGDRIKTAGDILDYDEFFLADEEITYDQKAMNKRLGDAESVDRLHRFSEKLGDVEPFDAEGTEAALRGFLEEENVKIGQVIHALRVAVTGKAVGLGMFEALELLGRDRVLRRIDRAVRQSKEQV